MHSSIFSVLRPLLVLSLASGLVLAVGCKKKPVQEDPMGMSPPDVTSTKPPQVPKEVMQMVQNFNRVYFDLDSSALSSSSKAALDDNIKLMQSNADIKLDVQGHADERGTTDYNLALGQRRANAVVRYMSAAGIPNSRLKVISYGEERPLEAGSYESAWTKNRRCEFVITWGGTDTVRGSTSG